ncbi:MAG: hypothetical protein WDN10_04215 [bacterium]
MNEHSNLCVFLDCVETVLRVPCSLGRRFTIGETETGLSARQDVEQTTGYREGCSVALVGIRERLSFRRWPYLTCFVTFALWSEGTCYALISLAPDEVSSKDGHSYTHAIGVFPPERGNAELYLLVSTPTS